MNICNLGQTFFQASFFNFTSNMLLLYVTRLKLHIVYQKMNHLQEKRIQLKRMKRSLVLSVLQLTTRNYMKKVLSINKKKFRLLKSDFHTIFKDKLDIVRSRTVRSRQGCKDNAKWWTSGICQGRFKFLMRPAWSRAFTRKWKPYTLARCGLRSTCAMKITSSRWEDSLDAIHFCAT